MLRFYEIFYVYCYSVFRHIEICLYLPFRKLLHFLLVLYMSLCCIYYFWVTEFFSIKTATLFWGTPISTLDLFRLYWLSRYSSRIKPFSSPLWDLVSFIKAISSVWYFLINQVQIKYVKKSLLFYDLFLMESKIYFPFFLNYACKY